MTAVISSACILVPKASLRFSIEGAWNYALFRGNDLVACTRTGVARVKDRCSIPALWGSCEILRLGDFRSPPSWSSPSQQVRGVGGPSGNSGFLCLSDVRFVRVSVSRLIGDLGRWQAVLWQQRHLVVGFFRVPVYYSCGGQPWISLGFRLDARSYYCLVLLFAVCPLPCLCYLHRLVESGAYFSIRSLASAVVFNRVVWPLFLLLGYFQVIVCPIHFHTYFSSAVECRGWTYVRWEHGW